MSAFYPLEPIVEPSEEALRERKRIVELTKTPACRVAFARGDAWAVEAFRSVVRSELAEEEVAAMTPERREALRERQRWERERTAAQYAAWRAR